MSEIGHQKDQWTSKYDTPSELLIPMIGGGRCFELKGNTFSFDKKGGFLSSLWGGIDTERMCDLLVGKVLTEVDPVHIPVDTLLLVSDEHLFENGETPMKPPSLCYFSHWFEGMLFCFSDGTTSMTAKQKTTPWKYYKYHDPIIAPDNTKENNNV